MTSNKDSKSPVSWWKALLNGFLAWLLAFILYLIPGFVVAISMGFDLGPKLKDNAEVGKLISHAVSELYQSNIYIHYGFVVLLAFFILWRSRVISKRSATQSVAPGVLVAIASLVPTAIQFALGGHILICVVAIVLFLLAGIIGASRKNLNAST